MAKNNQRQLENSTKPLIINGLRGRMLYLPSPSAKKRDIFLVYGLQSSLEHWGQFALELNSYGSVTMPDLPGFGGMSSFYKIGRKPTLDAFADYLAALVKLRYKRRRLTIVGIGFGFVIATRMLQRYPDLARKVDLVVSLNGLARYDDMTVVSNRRLLYGFGARLLASPLLSSLMRNTSFQPAMLRRFYTHRSLKDSGLTPGVAAEKIALWRNNDTRTYFMALSSLMKLDNCKQQVALPLCSVTYRSNKVLDSHLIDQHLRVIYEEVLEARSRVKGHGIGTLDYDFDGQLLPMKVRRLLS